MGGIDCIQACSHRCGTTLAQIGGQCVGVELASGELQLLREVLPGFKDLVWNRDGDFHRAFVSP